MEREEDEDEGDLLEDRNAFESKYSQDRTWETVEEDEFGLIKTASDGVLQQRQHRRRLHEASAVRIQRGIIRYLYLVLDFSAAASEIDYRPSRMAVIAKCAEDFIREYFDQNPLSQLGIIVMRNGVAESVTDLSGSPEAHIKALRASLESSGDPSLQNALDLAHSFLVQGPTYGHREVLIVFSALNTCDPGNIMDTLKKLKESSVRCSIVGLSAEIFICKLLCERTSGVYGVALNQGHLKELMLEHVPPPASQEGAAVASLVRMGFPQRGAEGAVAICACHKEVKLGGGYICPRCKARACELPSECNLCGLTLVSSPHLARSYHHLFPVPAFDELIIASTSSSKYATSCFACRALLSGRKINASRSRCPRCRKDFCFDCDVYIHESLHNCPGCEMISELNAKHSRT